MHKTFIIGLIFNVLLQTKTAFLGPLTNCTSEKNTHCPCQREAAPWGCCLDWGFPQRPSMGSPDPLNPAPVSEPESLNPMLCNAISIIRVQRLNTSSQTTNRNRYLTGQKWIDFKLMVNTQTKMFTSFFNNIFHDKVYSFTVPTKQP